MTRALKSFLAALTATTALLLGATVPAQAAPTGVKGILNAGSVGSLGIFEYFRTGGANYDATLPQNAWSHEAFDGWANFGGFYIGPGYCAQRYTSASESGPWTRVLPNVTGRSRTAGDYYVRIVPFRSATC